jgi:hypothetical protein
MSLEQGIGVAPVPVADWPFPAKGLKDLGAWPADLLNPVFAAILELRLAADDVGNILLRFTTDLAFAPAGLPYPRTWQNKIRVV